MKKKFTSNKGLESPRGSGQVLKSHGQIQAISPMMHATASNAAVNECA